MNWADFLNADRDTIILVKLISYFLTFKFRESPVIVLVTVVLKPLLFIFLEEFCCSLCHMPSEGLSKSWQHAFSNQFLLKQNLLVVPDTNHKFALKPDWYMFFTWKVCLILWEEFVSAWSISVAVLSVDLVGCIIICSKELEI